MDKRSFYYKSFEGRSPKDGISNCMSIKGTNGSF